MMLTSGNGCSIQPVMVIPMSSSLYGVLPASVYGTGNTQPDGSIAENWIETTDGDTILNHADYIAYNTDFDVDKVTEWTPERSGAVGSNRESGLQNLMDNPNINLFTAWRAGGALPQPQ